MTQAPTMPVAPPAARPGRRSAVSLAVSDCNVLIGRDLRHVVRDPEQIFQVVSLPIILLLLFRFLLGGAIQTSDKAYVDYVVAGLLVISMTFNSTTTVIGITNDLTNGIVERLRSMPIVTGALLVGHVVSGVLRSFVSVVVLILFALLVGFRPHASLIDWLAALGLLLLFVTTPSWLAVLLGLSASTPEGASGIGMLLVFLPYASSALVPSGSITVPALRAVVKNQPMTPVIDTIRGLMTNTAIGNSGWIAVAWWAGLLLVAVPLALRKFKRRTAQPTK
jgi:ABC-2 type transport system permease protein